MEVTTIYYAINNAMFQQFGTNLPLAHGSTLGEFDKYDLDVPKEIRRGFPKVPESNLRFDHVIYLVQRMPGWGPQIGWGCSEQSRLMGEFHEGFESYPRYTFGSGGTGVTWSASNYHSEGNACLSATYSSNANGYEELIFNDLDLYTTGSPKLEFDHICATESAADFGVIEYRINSPIWHTFPLSTYMGNGTIPSAPWKCSRF